MFQGGRGGQGPLAPVVKGVAAGIGLISEYRHHKKDQKNGSKNPEIIEPDAKYDDMSAKPVQNRSPSVTRERSRSPKPHGDVEILEDDEEHWKLDEAQDEVVDEAKPKTEHDPKKMVKQFTDAHPVMEGFEHRPLALPVVLPQRRPKNRTRGFIRAYAPELESCGVDEDTFLNLIETFNAATLAAPWLDAINLASLAFCTLPTGISTAISIAIMVAVDITKNMQSRHRHSYVLEQLNNEYFRPRGLYAVMLTWKPESNATSVGVNVNEAIADNLAERTSLFDKAKHSFRPSTGNTVGVAFAETAPLVFPVLDSLVNSETPESQGWKQKLKHGKGLVGEYFDRRAQAEHVGENPDSQLAVTKPTFTSRYSDPNHPTNNGDLLSLVSGGRLSRPPRGALLSQRVGLMYGMRNQRRGLLGSLPSYGRSQSDYMMNQQYQNDNYGGSQPYQSENVGMGRSNPYGNAGMGQSSQYGNQYGNPGMGQWSRSQNGLLQNGLLGYGIKRVFQHHVLYLSIINMPTEADLATANEYLKTTETTENME